MSRLESDDGAQSTDDSSPLRLLGDPFVLGTLIFVTSEFLMIGAYEAVWAVMLTDLGAQTWEVGLSFTIFAIPIGLLAPVGGSLGQRTGGTRVAAIGLLATAVIGLGFGLIDSVWGLIAVAALAGIGSGLGFPAGLFAYSQTVPDERQASSQGLMGATEVLLGGASAVLAAWLYDAHGRTVVWLVMPALMLVALGGGILVRSRGSRSRQREPVA